MKTIGIPANVEFQDGQILAYNKKLRTARMRHIDYGLGVLQSSALGRIPEGEACDLATLYQELLAAGELAAFEAPHRFYEIGSFSGIEELRAYLSRQAWISMSFSTQFLNEAKQVIDGLDVDAIDRIVAILAATRSSGGRLFILGVGGSAAQCLPCGQ